MPYTLSYAVVAIPLSLLARGRIPLVAVFIGSMSPDFPYLLELGELKGSIEQKALSISSWIVNLAAEQKALKEAAKTLTDRARVKANKIQSLKEYVGSVLEPGTKLENEECKISWRKSTALEILCDTEMLPSMYQKISVSVDKVGITKDIKAGKTIAGCELINKQNISIK